MCYSLLVEQDLQKLSHRFKSRIDQMGFDEYLNNSRVDPKRYKPLTSNPRIYPNDWAPIIVFGRDGRITTPMRYRIRPRGSSEEVPSKYNVFNCRLDAIETRRTWNPLFMRKHGVLVFKSFFEWVVDPETRKKRVIAFTPQTDDYVTCPVLWDEWQAPDGSLRIRSFAVITTDPAPEVLAQGHDRTPVFLKADHVDLWLRPHLSDRKRIYAVLSDTAPVHYAHAWAV